MTLLLGAVVALGVALSILSTWNSLAAVGLDVVHAVCIVPGLVCLHLAQLFLSGVGWRVLISGPAPAIATFYRLRIIREGIDSLLPVAQIGGEIVGARLLSQAGIPAARAGASVVVDLTIELLSQLAFLLTGLFLLAVLFAGAAWQQWAAPLLGGAATVFALLLLQRFGGLRLLEGLLRGIARRWPILAGASLDGIHAEALGLYREPRGIAGSIGLHALAWILGSIETWSVLHVIGIAVSPAEALIVESLGMAARSAGFAIPAALGAQEGGFVLAGAAVGLAASPLLALSLIKRLREITVGTIGLLLWRAAARTPVASF